jgi:ADP-ribose pyrophosphatase YjhB (NUDIX family)
MHRRTFPKEPLLGVGAAVIKDDSVLLVKRGKPPLAGTWSLPGGIVKPSESLEEAVIREVKEECGIDIEISDLIKEFEHIEITKSGKVKYHYIVFDFKTFYRGGTLVSSSDALDAMWVPIDELANYGVTRAVLNLIQEVVK